MLKATTTVDPSSTRHELTILAKAIVKTLPFLIGKFFQQIEKAILDELMTDNSNEIISINEKIEIALKNIKDEEAAALEEILTEEQLESLELLLSLDQGFTNSTPHKDYDLHQLLSAFKETEQSLIIIFYRIFVANVSRAIGINKANSTLDNQQLAPLILTQFIEHLKQQANTTNRQNNTLTSSDDETHDYDYDDDFSHLEAHEHHALRPPSLDSV